MMLLDKIQALYTRFKAGRADPSDLSSIDGWITEAKRLLLLKSLKDHDGMKYVTGIFSSEVEKINEQLRSQYSKELPDRERDRLLDRRELAAKYLSLFSGIEDELEKLETAVDNEG